MYNKDLTLSFLHCVLSLQSSCSAKWFVVAAEQLDNKAVPLSYGLMCNYFMVCHVCKDSCCQGDVYVLSDNNP